MSLTPLDPWSSEIPEFRLPPGEIHVWRAELDFDASALAEFRTQLDPGERARADRFMRSEDRFRFTASRGLLRRLLGRYLSRPPETLSFSYGPHGRPFLAGDPADSMPSFNLSHSGGLALFAFARDREVGIDVESLRDPIDDPTIARRYFHPGEATRLAALPEAERRLEFFRLWTRKEAYLKARGWGVGKIEAASEADPDYLIAPLELEKGYAAALAYRGPEARLRLLRWV